MRELPYHILYTSRVKKEERIRGFVETIWEWYGRHKRVLPWRDMTVMNENERAYRVLVSEVMLQQTQVSRVRIVFRNFLERFPAMQDLARASNRDVLLAWRGMGYNSRALRLRDAVGTVVANNDGRFPRSMEELRAIPGIGPYTAAAILNFAFNIPAPCIDTNIRRILHRTFCGPENTDGTWKVSDRELLRLAGEILAVAVQPEHRGDIPHDAANWHAALMDYGSLVQTKNSPKWDVCPLAKRGFMKATPANLRAPARGAAKENLKREPGRFVGSTYVPNRIFRGRIVEVLRDAEHGLGASEIGPEICPDWNDAHRAWLDTLLEKLVRDALLSRKGTKYFISSSSKPIPPPHR